MSKEPERSRASFAPFYFFLTGKILRRAEPLAIICERFPGRCPGFLM